MFKFGSKFVYWQENSSDEEIDVDETGAAANSVAEAAGVRFTDSTRADDGPAPRDRVPAVLVANAPGATTVRRRSRSPPQRRRSRSPLQRRRSRSPPARRRRPSITPDEVTPEENTEFQRRRRSRSPPSRTRRTSVEKLLNAFGSSRTTREGDGNGDANSDEARAENARQRRQERRRRRRLRKLDTNVINLALGDLANAADIATGDPTACTTCGAFLSSISDLAAADDGATDTTGPASDDDDDDDDDDVRLWTCEFCSTINEVDLGDEELPKAEAVDYIITPAPVADASGVADSHNVVFCIDTSGSMCVTTLVQGGLALRANEQAEKELAELRAAGLIPAGFGGGPPTRGGGTWVSRLQCVQAAIDQQLTNMARDHPNVHAYVVTFDSTVNILSADDSEPVIIAGDRLSSKDSIESLVAERVAEAPTVGTSVDTLKERLFNLQASGATALGPALTAALAIAGRSAGSSVILATDGIANVGLGAMDELVTDEASAAAEAFYEAAGNAARDAGVSVSVVSIAGDDEVKLELLGRVAELAGGEVDIVEAAQIGDNFGSMLADPVIATGVELSLRLPTTLQFADGEDDAEGNMLTRAVGNVNAGTNISVSYRVNATGGHPAATSTAEAAEATAATTATTATAEPSEAPPTEIPFQLVVTYTALDGMVCRRVITALKPVTASREEAEANAQADVMATTLVQTTARFARRGSYASAQANSIMGARFLSRTVGAEDADVLNGYVSQSTTLNTALSNQINMERAAGLNLGDTAGGGRNDERERTRSRMRADGTSRSVFQSMNWTPSKRR